VEIFVSKDLSLVLTTPIINLWPVLLTAVINLSPVSLTPVLNNAEVSPMLLTPAFITGVNNARGKFITGVNHTGNESITGVTDTVDEFIANFISSILITGVNDTGDRVLDLNSSTNIHKKFERIKLHIQSRGLSRFMKKTKSQKSGVCVSLTRSSKTVGGTFKKKQLQRSHSKKSK